MIDDMVMTPEFEREAAAVMGSPYFAVPSIADAREQVAAAERLMEEKRLLMRALPGCKTYQQLQGPPREIYDRAKKAITG